MQYEILSYPTYEELHGEAPEPAEATTMFIIVLLFFLLATANLIKK
jgi:hypothetical protein